MASNKILAADSVPQGGREISDQGRLMDAMICGARLATTTDDDLPVDTLILLAQCAIRR
jgi:hypothetical protein